MKKFYRICAIILSVCVLSLCALFASCSSPIGKPTGLIKIAPSCYKEINGINRLTIDWEKEIILSAETTEVYMEVEYDGEKHYPIAAICWELYHDSYGRQKTWLDFHIRYRSICRVGGDKSDIQEYVCDKGVYCETVYCYSEKFGEKILTATVIVK